MFISTRPSFVIGLVATTGVLALGACDAPQSNAPAQPSSEPTTAAVEASQSKQLTSEWASLGPLIGQYPSQSGLFENSAIVAPLKTLLGNKYDTFTTNMGVQGPLSREGEILYVSGNKPHEGGSNAAYLLIDPYTQTLEIGLWENGKLTVYPANGTTIAKPQDIQTMLSNAAQ